MPLTVYIVVILHSYSTFLSTLYNFILKYIIFVCQFQTFNSLLSLTFSLFKNTMLLVDFLTNLSWRSFWGYVLCTCRMLLRRLISISNIRNSSSIIMGKNRPRFRKHNNAQTPRVGFTTVVKELINFLIF